MTNHRAPPFAAHIIGARAARNVSRRNAAMRATIQGLLAIIATFSDAPARKCGLRS
jgi:hypothetical protein